MYLFTPLTKSVLIPLGLYAGMSGPDAAIPKKTYGSGCLSDLALRVTVLKISNKEGEDVMKIV